MMLPRHAEIWLADYLWSMARARRELKKARGVVDILFAVADHFEPLHGNVSLDTGLRRVKSWMRGLPAMASRFVDADGRHPQHTFFYPIEQYRPELLDHVAQLCGQGFGEVEVHLHHDADTAENFRLVIQGFTRNLSDQHGLLSRDLSGAIRYGFIHGNWALSNSLPGGRWCGVDEELAVLRDTGCYGDFTNPAAPSPAQTRTVNQLYYATGPLRGPRAHDRGVPAAAGRSDSAEDLLIVQGPLVLRWQGAKWGVLPRLDNSSIHAGYPPTIGRFTDWVSCKICVAGRPEWVFVKVYAHGAPEANMGMLLGPEMAEFHRELLATFNDGERFRLHYVTTREMVNIIHAAEDGMQGNPGQYRDYRLAPPSLIGTWHGTNVSSRHASTAVARPGAPVMWEARPNPSRPSPTIGDIHSSDDTTATVPHADVIRTGSSFREPTRASRLRRLGIGRDSLARWIGRTGGWSLLRRAVPWKGILCLNYHRVGDGRRSAFDRGVYSADAEGFEDQVRFLKLHYDVVSPLDLADVLRRGKGRYVLLTFDDAYLDNHSIAFPILRHHGVAATFFVATGFLDRHSLSWWDEIAWMVRSSTKHSINASRWSSTRVVFDGPDRETAIRSLLTTYKTMPADSNNEYLAFLAEATGSGRYQPTGDGETWMSWEMLREMRTAGMVIGGHTVNHPVLAQLSAERQWEEISGCGRRRAEELGEPMRYFSYPVGSLQAFNEDTRACLKRAGVQYAFSYYGGMRSFEDWDDLDVQRVSVERMMSLDWVQALVTLPRLYGRAR